MGGDGLDQDTYGFLYLEYGPTAWWWEVEELVRKLLLSSLVVLIDAGSPLQVRPVPRWGGGSGLRAGHAALASQWP
jgi:hypothetical protein